MASDLPYTTSRLPPSLVTVENGFTFHGTGDTDSDISSLNTTPRKDERKTITTTHRISPQEIDEADLGLKYSKANHHKPWETTKTKSPPSQVILNNNETRGRSRHDKLADRKEKYRRMASDKGWKQAAEDRRAAERNKPWFIPDEQEQEEESPAKPVKHDFDESSPESKKESLPKAAPEAAPKASPTLIQPKKREAAPEQAPPVTRSFMAKSRSLFRSDSSEDEAVSQSSQPQTQVDMYGCPIFQVESEDSEEKAARTKLDHLDATMKDRTDFSSIMSNATLFSSAASKTLTDARVALEGAGHVVEELVLGPVPEVDESEISVDDTAKNSKSPPRTPPRKTSNSAKSSPSASSTGSSTQPSTAGSASSWWVEEELGRRRRKKGEKPSPPRNDPQSVKGGVETPVETSFVLEDSSDVDASSVLDDLHTLERSPLRKNKAKKQDNEEKLASRNEQDARKTEYEKEVSEEEKKESSPSVFTVGLAIIQAQIQEAQAQMRAAQEPHRNMIEGAKDSDKNGEESNMPEVNEQPQVTDSANASEVKREPETLDNTVDDGDLYCDTSNEVEYDKTDVKDSDGVHDSVLQEVPQDTTTENVSEAESDHVPSINKPEEKTLAYTEASTSVVTSAIVGDSVVSGETMDALHAIALENKDESEGMEKGGTEEESKTVEEPKSPEVAGSPQLNRLECSNDTMMDALDSHAVSAIAAGAATAVTIKLSEPTEEPEPPKEEIKVEMSREVNEEIEKAAEAASSPSKFIRPQSVRAMSVRSFPPTEDDDIVIDIDSISSASSEGTPVHDNLNEESLAARAAKVHISPPEVFLSKSMPAMKLQEMAKPKEESGTKKADKSNGTSPAASPNEAARSNMKPAMVKTLDDANGIAKGDILLSLFNGNLSEANRAPKGGDQVRDAIMRMRSMRRRQEKVDMAVYEPPEKSMDDSPSKRSVLPVDVDDTRVVGGFEHVKTLEQEAIEHLKLDEFEAALELYDDIIVTYAETFKEEEEEKGRKKGRKKASNGEKDQAGHKSYTGAAFHNIGILHLLQSNFEEALDFFNKAAECRKSHFGAGSVDHVVSLEKIAICHYALDNYEEAHKLLEDVLELSKKHLEGLTDFMQIAEILNNLGCLSFMCGQTGDAMNFFRECLEIQNSVLKQSLYGGPVLGGQSTSLSISITRGNVGYIRMLTKNAGAAMIEFEAALMHQQMILSDAHDTVICTMDHLAVANLLADKKELALKMLSRMLRAQLDAYGADDDRCILTLSKLQLVQTQETNYLEKALEQLWKQHTTASSGTSPKGVNKKSKNVLKKFSFRKKAAKLNNKQ